jgi:hypothetical protein
MTEIQSVFLVQHEYEQWGRDEAKLIGVYRTRAEANDAIDRARSLEGFRNWPDGFTVDEYTLGKDSWTEGFCTIVPIHVQVVGSNPVRWACVHATWHPGDKYRIVEGYPDPEQGNLAFSPGAFVRCEERVLDGNPGCLVAVSAIEGTV